jgi:hypothetical protein
MSVEIIEGETSARSSHQDLNNGKNVGEKKKVWWVNGAFVVFAHLMALYGLFYVPLTRPQTFWLVFNFTSSHLFHLFHLWTFRLCYRIRIICEFVI